MENPKNLKILIVDDEEKICEMFVKWLSLRDHKVQFALDGKKAIRLAKQETFDFVFLDIVMPGISTHEILEEIREISSSTKVVMITGKLINSGLLNELKLKGASDFLQKPFRLDDVMKLLPDQD
jgi:two-component system alkaline phosphatase synthesis response regulator PhoP